MIKFVSNGKVYSEVDPTSETYYLTPSENFSSFLTLDEGFFWTGQKPVRSPASRGIKVGDYYVNKGLTMLFGPPGSGKTFFVDNKISADAEKLKWGEPEAGFKHQSMGTLLHKMNKILGAGKGFGVIDSIMPLIISSDENLGQGGLSKRVLTYMRQLAAITYELDAHLVLVANPLESGAFVGLWADYFKAVAHSVIVVNNQKAAISSRLTQPDAQVPTGRNFGGEEGFVMTNANRDLPNAFDSALAGMRGTGQIPQVLTPERVTERGVIVSEEYGKFPAFRGDPNAQDITQTQ